MFKRLFIIVIVTVPLLSGCAALFTTSALVGTDIASDRRTTGMYIEDQSIELKSSTAISEDSSLSNSSSIGITSFNRIVLIVGQTPTQELRDHASEVVRKIDNIRKVHNELRVAAPGSFLSGTNDTWLTTKAKALMFAEKDFPSSHVKVITENGELFLMGMVTRAEAEKAIAIVRDIDGVERVIQVFEYITSAKPAPAPDTQ